MFDWGEICGDLPEQDPGGDFLKDFQEDSVLNHEVVRSVKNEEVNVPEQVVQVLAEAPVETLSILGANEIVRTPRAESRWYQFDLDGALKIEGGAVIADKKDQLLWAKDNNLAMFRELIFTNYEYYLDYAYSQEPKEALKWYRMLRSVTPVLNIVSKKLEVIGAGLCSLAKIRSIVDRAYELGAERRIVAFGVGNRLHHMSYHSDILYCVDVGATALGRESSYFMDGSLLDWRKYVDEGVLIISDCSTGSNESAGMDIPRHYYQVYKDMVAAGHYVVCKINKFCIPMEEDWKVASLVMYREHNFEAYVLLCPDESKNIYRISELNLADGMKVANDARMYKILSRNFETQGVRICVRESELEKALNFASVVYTNGEKNYSVIRDIFNRFSDHLGRDWRKLCFEKEPKFLEFDEYLKTDVEFPCILIDVEFMAADKERLFASFFRNCEMEFYDEVGWVAVELKIDKD